MKDKLTRYILPSIVVAGLLLFVMKAISTYIEIKSIDETFYRTNKIIKGAIIGTFFDPNLCRKQLDFTRQNNGKLVSLATSPLAHYIFENLQERNLPLDQYKLRTTMITGTSQSAVEIIFASPNPKRAIGSLQTPIVVELTSYHECKPTYPWTMLKMVGYFQ